MSIFLTPLRQTLAITVLIVLLFNRTVAAQNDTCICQTGSAPENEVKFFKLGCKAWIASQRCSTKIISSIDESIHATLEKVGPVKTLKVGYVGHWSGSAETVSHISEQIVPSIQRFHLEKVDIDNTACLGGNNPYEILEYFKSIPPSLKARINFRGNQVISTGMWDPLLPAQTNFWSVTNGNSSSAYFPTCDSFEGKTCYLKFQEDDKAICYDPRARNYRWLSCSQQTEKLRVPTVRGHVYRSKAQNLWRALPEDEIQIERHTNKILNYVVLGIAPNRFSFSLPTFQERNFQISATYISDKKRIVPKGEMNIDDYIEVTRYMPPSLLNQIGLLDKRPNLMKNHKQISKDLMYSVYFKSRKTKYILKAFDNLREAENFKNKIKADPRYLLSTMAKENL